jgi:N-acetylmuramoyl-L-alanine amidase
MHHRSAGRASICRHHRAAARLALVVGLTAALVGKAAECRTPRDATAPAPAGQGRPLVVVVDAGHGGTLTGAPGVERGVHEKTLTLEIARHVRRHLAELGRFRVELTRERDEYLTLAERVRRANAWRGNLFVSIHLNASTTRGLQGFGLYLLSREASDREAHALARRENSEAVARPGNDGGRSPAGGEVAVLLAEMEQKTVQAEAARLAACLRRRLLAVRGAHLDHGIHQAPFDVLMGLRMPAVLLELGYIDHPVEGRVMAQPEVMRRLGEAVALAIADFRDFRDSRPLRGSRLAGRRPRQAAPGGQR